MHDNFKVDKVQTAEILVPQASTLQNHYFPPQPNLRNVPLTALETFGVDTVSTSPNGVALISDALAAASYLVLMTATNNQFVLRIPYVSMNITGGVAATYYQFDLTEFSGQEVVWEKSYMFIANTALISGAQDESFLFSIYYH